MGRHEQMPPYRMGGGYHPSGQGRGRPMGEERFDPRMMPPQGRDFGPAPMRARGRGGEGPMRARGMGMPTRVGYRPPFEGERGGFRGRGMGDPRGGAKIHQKSRGGPRKYNDEPDN